MTTMPAHSCDRGWVDFNADHPKPCRTCKPHLYACRSCGITVRECHRLRPDACCPRCPHTPPRLKRTRRKK
jgi:hypothetical protein